MTVNFASITQVWWGVSPNCSVSLARGSNTILTLTGSDMMQFAERGATLLAGGNTAANCVVAFSNASPGFLRVEFQKNTNVNWQNLP